MAAMGTVRSEAWLRPVNNEYDSPPSWIPFWKPCWLRSGGRNVSKNESNKSGESTYNIANGAIGYPTIFIIKTTTRARSPVSPNKQYRGLRVPTTSATTGPEWKPWWLKKNTKKIPFSPMMMSKVQQNVTCHEKQRTNPDIHMATALVVRINQGLVGSCNSIDRKLRNAFCVIFFLVLDQVGHRHVGCGIDKGSEIFFSKNSNSGVLRFPQERTVPNRFHLLKSTGAKIRLRNTSSLQWTPTKRIQRTLNMSCCCDNASNFVYKRSNMFATFLGSSLDDIVVKPGTNSNRRG